MLNELQKKYLELTKFGPYPSPYFFHIRRGGQILYYLGFDHTYDPKDLTWGVLENYLQDFIDQTDGKKRMVMVEGGEKMLPYNKKEMVKSMGEAYYTWFLAQSSALQVVSPEPDTIDQLNYLSQKYPKDIVVTSMFVEQIVIRSYYIKPDSIESSLENYLNYIRDISKWDNGLFDLKNISECYKRTSGVDLDYNNLEYIKKETDPYGEEDIINEIINLKSQYKDKIILTNIGRLWKKGYNLFIVFGKAHSIIHELTIKNWD